MELRTQPATTHLRREKDTDGFKPGELEEGAKTCYYPSLPRRGRLQGEMWSEIQQALKTKRKSGSAGRPVGAEFGQKPGEKISENRFHLLTSHPPPPYTSVKDIRTRQGEILSSPPSRPPNYTPPPVYTSRASCSSESRPHNESPSLSVLFSSRKAGTVTSTDPDRTEPQQELLPLSQKQVRNQQDVFTPQPSGHYEKYPTSHSDETLPEPDKRRRRGGTLFCLVSHTGFSSSKNQPLKCQTFPLLKSSTITETREKVQLADKADSCGSLTSFSIDHTPKEPRKGHGNHRDQNVRLFNHVEELRRNGEDIRKQSNEKRCFTDPNKKNREDVDSNENKNKIIPAVSHKSTLLVVPHHHTTLKIPSWKEPKSHHRTTGILKKSSKANRCFNRKGQCEQSEQTGLVVIDATCRVIKVQFIASPEKEHIQYVSSCPNDSRQTYSSNQSSDSNPDIKSTEAGSSSTELEIINQTNHTSSEVQPQHETFKERTERILETVLQNSFNEAHTLEETTPMKDSSIHQIHDTLEGSAKELECESSPIKKTSQPNEEATSSLMPEAEAMWDISEVMTNTKQEDELESLDRKFMLMEKIPTTVIVMKENIAKGRCGGTSTGETEDLRQTLLRNTCETFSQRKEETDEGRDIHQMLCDTSVENSSKSISPATQENFSNVGGAETISDLLTETKDKLSPWFLLSYSYETETSKMFDQEHKPIKENPSVTFQNLQKTREIFGLKEGHHQENLVKLQNLSPNLLSTSKTLHQESSCKQNLLYTGDPQVSQPFLEHHVKNTDVFFAHEGFSRREIFLNVCPNILNSISDTLIQKEIQREEIPSHAKQDANDFYQTLRGNSMKRRSKSCDHQDAVGEGNLSSEDIIHLSVKDIREPSDDGNPFHKDGVETISSVFHGENVDQCETTDMKKNFSPNTFPNTKELSEAPEHEASSEKQLHSDDLQNLCHILFGGSSENVSELFKQKYHEGKISPSPDVHISKDEFTPNVLSTSDSEISSHPPDSLLSTSLSPLVAGSSQFKPSDSLSEVLNVHAQVYFSAASTARDHIRAKHRPQSLWDAVSRIRKHTAPDSESEDEDSELWESKVNTGDDEEPGMKEKESELEERSGCARNNGSEGTEEEERCLGKREDDDDDDDSVSCSSVDSQDTVIEGEGKRNVLETNEKEKNEQKSDLIK